MGCVFVVNSDKGDRVDVEVEAPKGFHFEGEGLHCLVGSQWDGQSASDVYDDLLDRMSGGLSRCDNGGCNGDCKNGMLERLGIQQDGFKLRPFDILKLAKVSQ